MKKLIDKKKESLNKMMCEEICSAALELIREFGFSGLTMDRIAERLGTAKGTLYYYFKNKDSLVLEIANMISAPLLKKLRSINDDNAASSDKLSRVAKVLIRHFELYHDFHFMLYEQYGHKYFDQECMINEREEICKNIKDIIEKGIAEKEFNIAKVEVAVECFVGIVMHFNISKRMKKEKDKKIKDSDIDDAINLYLCGINNK